jgi:hypothetical protein
MNLTFSACVPSAQKPSTEHIADTRQRAVQITGPRLGAVVMAKASDDMVEKGRRIPASLLEAAEPHIEFARRRFTAKGTDRYVPVMPDRVWRRFALDKVRRPTRWCWGGGPDSWLHGTGGTIRWSARRRSNCQIGALAT